MHLFNLLPQLVMFLFQQYLLGQPRYHRLLLLNSIFQQIDLLLEIFELLFSISALAGLGHKYLILGIIEGQ